MDIWWMETPLLVDTYGDWFGKVGMKHVAVGIVLASDPTVKYSLSYVARYSFFNTFSPHMENYTPGKGCNMTWCNQGQICTEKGFNETHWSHETYPNANMTWVGSIPGDAFNAFIDQWLYPYQLTPHIYNILSVVAPSGKQYLKTYTCEIFGSEVLAAMSKFGAKFWCSNGIPTIADMLLYVSSPPEPLNPVPSNPELCDFYSRFPNLATDSFLGVVDKLGHVALSPRKFVWGDGQYYSVKPTDPYMLLSKYKLPIPGC
jgi:hypothetical protein